MINAIICLGFLLIIIVGSPWFIVRVLGQLCSLQRREMSRKQKVVYTIGFIAAVASLLCLVPLFVPGPGGIRASKKATTQNDVAKIQTAILNYEGEYGVPPPGKDNASLIKELEGDNPRGIVFLNIMPRDKNAKGEAVDAWGYPIEIKMTDPSHPVVRSVAPDKLVNASEY
jgi:hypothetical protein